MIWPTLNQILNPHFLRSPPPPYGHTPPLRTKIIGLSIYSYIDHVVFSCLANPEVLDNPTDLCQEYVKAFDHLERMVLGQNYENTCGNEVRERTSRTLEISNEEENRLRESKALAASVNTNACVSRAKAEKRARVRSSRRSSSGHGQKLRMKMKEEEATKQVKVKEEAKEEVKEAKEEAKEEV